MNRPIGLGEYSTNELIEELAARGIKINRLEVIDPDKGRTVIRWTEENFKVVLKKQDGGRTLKLFVEDDND